MRFQPLSNPFIRVIALVTAFWCLFLAWWLLGGKSVLNKLAQKLVEPWADFKVPENAVLIGGLQVSSANEILTICNKGGEEWSEVLIQIDQGYVAPLDRLRAGACKEIPIQKFVTASFKRIPAPPGLVISKVEVLATVVRKGYAFKQLQVPVAGTGR